MLAHHRVCVVHLPFHPRQRSPSYFVLNPAVCKLFIGLSLVQAAGTGSQSERQPSPAAGAETLTFPPARRQTWDELAKEVGGGNISKIQALWFQKIALALWNLARFL